MAKLDYSAKLKIYIRVREDGKIVLTRIAPDWGDNSLHDSVDAALERVREAMEDV